MHHATIGQRLYKSICQCCLPTVGHSEKKRPVQLQRLKLNKKEDNCEQIAGALPSNADDDLHVAGVCVCVGHLWNSVNKRREPRQKKTHQRIQKPRLLKASCENLPFPSTTDVPSFYYFIDRQSLPGI